MDKNRTAKWAKVQLSRFKGDSTSGTVINLMVVPLEIITSDEQVYAMRGCHSLELVTAQIPWVAILGRRFIVSGSTSTKEAEFEVNLPQDLAVKVEALMALGYKTLQFQHCLGCPYAMEASKHG